MAVKALSGNMAPLMGNGPAAAPAGPAGLVDRIMEAEAAPMQQARARRDRVVQEKNDYASLGSMVGDLEKVAGGIKTPAGFRKLAVESSHPDILEGVVDGIALPGSYEMEVRGLAQSDKHLAFGFPDVDKTEIGFGYLGIEDEGGVMKDITLDPGSTLKDAVGKINDTVSGVHAQIINTGISDEPFRLLVTSEKTGEAAKLLVDPDTTFLDFKKLKEAANLDVRFEDVDVQRADNKLDDLVEGVKLKAKRAEPGTKVTVNVTHDVDKTMVSIKDLTENYNKIAKLAHESASTDPAAAGEKSLANSSDVRSMMRSMQGAVTTGGDMLSALKGSKYTSLADIGITTNAKTGELVTDETKLKAALADDYERVSKIFTASDSGEGIAGRITAAVQRFKDPVNGVLASRQRGLGSLIKNQDQQIERQERRLEDRRGELENRFNAMQSRVQGLEAQGAFLNAQAGAAPQKAPA